MHYVNSFYTNLSVSGQKVSGFWSSVGFKIGAVTRFVPPIRDTCIRGDQNISQIQSMVANRGLTNQANVHTPMWKSRSVARQNLAILAAIGHRFIAPKKENSKFRRAGLRRRARRPETGDFYLLALGAWPLYVLVVLIFLCEDNY